MGTQTYDILCDINPKSKISEIDFDNLGFGKTFTDHMLVCRYRNGAWTNPIIKAFSTIDLFPSISGLHYGQLIFEGMKAFRKQSEQIILFRPDENFKRFNLSAERLCMPAIPEYIFIEGIKKLVKIDRTWVPKGPKHSLYVRPFMFASEAKLGIDPATEYTFAVILSPMGAYYSQPLKVKIETTYSRAASGGVGAAKCAGNYAAAMYPAKLAQKEGFNQIIWTDSSEHKYIEELGSANVIFKKGSTLITPDSETILKSITRKSVLQMAKNMGLSTEKRKVSVKEVIDGIANGSITEVFACGTAAAITPIRSIFFNDKTYELPEIDENSLSSQILSSLENMRLGVSEDIFGWNVLV